MKARPRATLFLKIMIPALAVMVPVAAFGVALDYAITCGKIVGCVPSTPAGSTPCGFATNADEQPSWLRDMSNAFATGVNGMLGGSGPAKMSVVDSSLLKVCNRSYNEKCLDQYPGGINSEYVGLLALHGSSNPVSNPTAPTFYPCFSSYQKSNNISGVGDCEPQVFGKMYLGLPSLRFLMVLSCDSMNVADDLPIGSNQQQGWFKNSWGVHTISGFSGIDHAWSSTANVGTFFTMQRWEGVGHGWLNHFVYFSPTGNNTAVGASDCPVSMMLGTTLSDAANRWNETINSPNAMANPVPPNMAYQIGYYCGCCADYGGNEILPGHTTAVHCTPSC
jgi:hypothetical protein